MHEIITLQLGQRANYLATHFWNSQESYFTYSANEESLVDHDVHFRPGIGADGTETFTPRTVIYDLKGGFGSLRKINALYEIEEEGVPQALWNGPTIIQRQNAIEQHTYQQSLENGDTPPPLTTDTVRYWSDFNRVYFHPRSIVQLNDYELNSSLMPFESWEVGKDLFESLDKEHDLLDRDLRPFAEEADHMQGIQLMASVDDAWGGFATQYLDRIRDEYGKTTVWIWGMENELANTPRAKQFLKLSNTAHSLAGMSSSASLYTPLALPSQALPTYVDLDRRSEWHRSALLSTAVESMTLPSRLKPREGVRQSLDGLAASLNVNGNQKIARLKLSIGFDAVQEETNGVHSGLNPGPTEALQSRSDARMPLQNGRASVVPAVDDDDVMFDMDLFPTYDPSSSRGRNTSMKCHIFGQAEAFRGVGTDAHLEADDFDGLTRARRRAAGLPIIYRSKTPLAYKLLDSFPHIYTLPQALDTISVRTSLSTDTNVAARIKSLRSIVSRAIGVEEREALTNTLGEIAEAYEEGWDSGSDSDDD